MSEPRWKIDEDEDEAILAQTLFIEVEEEQELLTSRHDFPCGTLAVEVRTFKSNGEAIDGQNWYYEKRADGYHLLRTYSSLYPVPDYVREWRGLVG